MKKKGRNGGWKHPMKQISGYGLRVRCVVSRRRATPIHWDKGHQGQGSSHARSRATIRFGDGSGMLTFCGAGFDARIKTSRHSPGSYRDAAAIATPCKCVVWWSWVVWLAGVLKLRSLMTIGGTRSRSAGSRVCQYSNRLMSGDSRWHYQSTGDVRVTREINSQNNALSPSDATPAQWRARSTPNSSPIMRIQKWIAASSTTARRRICRRLSSKTGRVALTGWQHHAIKHRCFIPTDAYARWNSARQAAHE